MNYGVNLEKEKNELKGDEYKFGASAPTCLFAVNSDLRIVYLPHGEVQFGKEDFMDCVSRGYINGIETKFTYALRNNLILNENEDWLREKGYIVVRDGLEYVEFSDRFIAMLSGTTRQGNSLKAPADAIYRYGLTPKKLLPKRDDMTFDEYHNKNSITNGMFDLGKEFLERFRINYDQVSLSHLEAVLANDMVGIAVHAWGEPVQGEYKKTKATINHCVLAFALPKTYIYDNYFDGDFVKKLASDYLMFDYGYRVYVSAQDTPKKQGILSSLQESIQNLFRSIFK